MSITELDLSAEPVPHLALTTIPHPENFQVGPVTEASALPSPVTLKACEAVLAKYASEAQVAKAKYLLEAGAYPDAHTSDKYKKLLAAGYAQVITPLRDDPIIDNPTEPAPTREQVREVVIRVRRVLRQSGWTQGSMVLKGKRCLLGAIHFVLAGTDQGSQWVGDRPKLHEAVLEAVAQGCDPMHAPYMVAYPSDKLPNWLRVERRSNMARVIYCWNDHPSRNYRQVSKMLKRVIKNLA